MSVSGGRYANVVGAAVGVGLPAVLAVLNVLAVLGVGPAEPDPATGVEHAHDNAAHPTIATESPLHLTRGS
jgi:hypothetical protein